MSSWCRSSGHKERADPLVSYGDGDQCVDTDRELQSGSTGAFDVLRHTQEKDLAGSLARSNEDLAATVLTNRLTGFANRSAIGNCLTAVWSDPALARNTFSAIMADVDHFKSLIYRYDHLPDDRVLKRFSKLNAEAPRGEHDFSLRFGAKKPVVILPRTPCSAWPRSLLNASADWSKWRAFQPFAMAIPIAQGMRGTIRAASQP